MGGLPSGTVTFLFTDIEGSTRLWEQHGDSMRESLSRHDEILRRAVAASGGAVVKTTGDGALAAFASALDGVRAATDAQRALAVESWPAGAPIRARMALHTGTAEERDGDYFGPTLNRAARLMAIGHGGQILVSHATAAVLGESVELLDLGEHRLRDLSRAEHVHQVVGAGLAAAFPKLRSLDLVPTNLPLQLTSFVGRDDELARVTKLVGEHRIVTLTGTGGVGKTRLALQVAADLVDTFSGGAWVSELAPARDEETLLDIVAATFSVQRAVGARLQESITETLRGRQVLWVLDNCEHLVLDAARLADQVLRAAPGVTLLATSREDLGIDGEYVVPVRPMTVASSDDNGSESDALRLFADRAQAARHDFHFDEHNSAQIEELCRRLDGIPLAIELAASRTASMTVSDILEHLNERFRLLTGGRRVALERQQTLRGTLDWSYSLLDASEQHVFVQLSVFSGSFDADAVVSVAVTDDHDAWAVRDALDALVRKSMVVAEETPDGTTRYGMLETMRQYGSEMIEQADGAERVRRRHAEHYAGVAEAMRERLLGRDELSWRPRFAADLDNVRAGAHWALDAHDLPLITRYLRAIAEEHYFGGLRIGAFASRAVELADELDEITRGVATASAALEAYDRGEVDLAVELGQRAWDYALSLDHPSPAAVYSMRTMPGVAMVDSMGRGVEAMRRWSRAEITASGTAAESARIYCSFATMALQTGALEDAREWAATSVELARQSGNPSSLAEALYEFGACTAAFDPDAAESAFAEAADLGRNGAVAIGHAAALFQWALMKARRGEHASAAALLQEAIETLRPRGRTPELDGACGYALEILPLLGRREACVIALGAVFDGTLRNLREMAVPPDREPLDVRGLRAALGQERFNELIERGARMTYEEILDVIVDSLVDS